MASTGERQQAAASAHRTEIEWVNHASFVVRHGDTALLCDPWLYGPAFNDGWELAVPSVHGVEVFDDVTAVWISHVHPDHFAPRVLRDVPRLTRRRTPVYFQQTMDQQVAKFCRGIGYPVTEVPDGDTVEVAPGFRLTVGRVPFYDAWAFIETPDARILNLNDCVLSRPQDLQRIADQVGDVDVLLTQFSYANWIGGPDDTAERRAAAREKLEWMTTQMQVIQPTWCVPFASFVVFAHEENAYLNDARNTVRDAVETIEKASVRPAVLFPGDVWTVGDDHDAEPAIARYEAAWEPAGRPLNRSESVPLEKLEDLAGRCVKRLRKRNNRVLLRAAALVGVGGPLLVRVTDLDVLARFSPLSGLSVVESGDPDVSMTSQSLAYTLKFDWGADTLSVNGRFAGTPAGYRKMLRTFGPALLNNNGRGLSFRLLLDPWLVRRAFDRFVLRAS